MKSSVTDLHGNEKNPSAHTAKHILNHLLLYLLLFSFVGVHAQSGFAPGKIVPELAISSSGLEPFFQCYDIPDTIFALMKGKSYKDDCTVQRSDLRYLLILHRNIKGEAIVGELIVNKNISADILDIMEQLFRASYPIEKVRLIDYYDADDEKSMRANNTSCFNWRKVSGSSTVSKHAIGMAIDINPLYNPYYKLSNGKETIQPATGKPYLDREAEFPYKIIKGDICHRLFTTNGFKWGGSWTSLKDYQHFER